MPLKSLFDRGDVALGTFVYLSDPAVVEVAAAAGMDFVILDLEHTSFDMQEVVNGVRAAEATGIAAIVRVSSMDPKAVLRALEAGAEAVMLPMVASAQQAIELVKATKYPPGGDRGTCRIVRASQWGYFNDDYANFQRRANEDVLTMGLIEERSAAEEIDEITRELDVTIIGRADVASELGVPGQLDHPLVQEVVSRHEKAFRTSGRVGGCLVHTAADAQDRIAAGYRMVIFSIDANVLRLGFKNWVDAARDARR